MEFSVVLQQGIAEIKHRLAQLVCGREPQRIQIKLASVDFSHAPAWLAAQDVYPQLFWQNRSQSQAVIGLGQSLWLQDKAAQDYLFENTPDRESADFFYFSNFSQQHKAWPGFPASLIIKPMLELRQEHGCVYLSCCLLGEQALRKARELVSRLTSGGTRLDASSNNHSFRTDIPNFPNWQQDMAAAKQAFNAQLLQKVVLARESRLHHDDKVNFWALFKRWRDTSQNSYQIAIRLAPEQGFMSFTPETLFSREHKELRTEALAGTIVRGDNAHDDNELAMTLLHDDKNCHEHQLVVEDIQQKLAGLGVSTSQGAVRGLIKINGLQHLYYPIRASLPDNCSDNDLITALHPTAAVCGMPAQQAEAFILQQENFDRGWYAGCCGRMSAHQSEIAVSIRCARVEGKDVFLYAGAGIVPASETDAEWQELDNKIAAPLSMFGTEARSVSGST